MVCGTVGVVGVKVPEITVVINPNAVIIPALSRGFTALGKVAVLITGESRRRGACVTAVAGACDASGHGDHTETGRAGVPVM